MIKSELIVRIAAQNPHLYATEVEARTHVHFKPGKTIQARLNRVEVDPEEEAKQLLQAS